MTLHFAVLSFDRYSRDSLIGEVFYTLNEKDALDAIDKEQISIQKDIVLRSVKVRTDGSRHCNRFSIKNLHIYSFVYCIRPGQLKFRFNILNRIFGILYENYDSIIVIIVIGAALTI